MRLRVADPEDGDALAGIYGPMVATTAVSFELDPPSGTEMGERVADTLPDHPWLVADTDDGVVGYAYAHRFHLRAAYDWSVETSVYVHPDHWRAGVGRSLYGGLIAILREQGYCRAVAGVTLPNPASVRLHERAGFRPVGVYHRIGWKLGGWHDVGMWELDLRPEPRPPTAPTAFRRLSPRFLATTLATPAGPAVSG
jgi:phosphinothricin acetyltransferase